MNWLTIVLIAVLTVSTLIGLSIGLVRGVLSLAGLIAGVVLAGRYHLALSTSLTFIPSSRGANIVAFALILIGVLIVTAIIIRLFDWALKLVMLAWVNKLAGAAVGLVLGALLCGAALALWLKYFGPNQTILNSTLAQILLDRIPFVLSLLPKDFGQVRSFF